MIVRRDDIAALYRDHGVELWRAMLVVTGGRGDVAEDATAEAFSRLVASRVEVRDPRAWLYRTGSRIAIAELRQERRSSPAIDPEPHEVEPALSPELIEALRSLSPDQRLALYLTYYADLPLREVARLTGSSVTAVKVRLHRARRILRTTLTEEAHV